MQQIDFLKTALKDFKVGAITASSKYAVKRIVKEIPPACRSIIEYGAGDGIITKKILDKLPTDGKIIAVEINHGFVGKLREIKDARLEVSANDVAVFSKNLADANPSQTEAVISGVPFTFLKPRVRGEIIRATYDLLVPGGIFIVYQYSTLILPELKKYFPEIKIMFEPRNLPPYFIMKALKGKAGAFI